MAVMTTAFDPQYGEAWNAAQTRSMLDLPGSYLIAARLGDEVVGFAMIRAIAGEAELLLLAVDPTARRQGIGRNLLAKCIAVATDANADVMYLEVREDNDAIILYRSAQFEQYNIRRAYYRGTDGITRSALSFRRPIVKI